MARGGKKEDRDDKNDRALQRKQSSVLFSIESDSTFFSLSIAEALMARHIDNNVDSARSQTTHKIAFDPNFWPIKPL